MNEIDHRTVIAGLSASDRAELTRRTDAPGLARLFLHFGLIAALGAWIAAGAPFWPVAMPFLGVLVVFLFTTVHETIHETAYASPWLNRAVANLSGFAILLPPVWFRYFHFAHHRFTHDPERDPELMSPKPETWGQYALYLSGLPYWTSMIRVLFVNASGRNADDFVPPRGRDKIVREARVFLALYAGLAVASVATASTVLLWVWIVPILIGQPFLRAYLLAEHTRCPHVANMLENTRTTYTTRLVRLFAWNMPYHAVHHAYPAVPFHKLPRFHGVVRDHLKSTEKGYGRFHRKFAQSLGAE